MKFLDIRSYIIVYVYIVYLCNLSAIRAYHVCLLVSVTLFVFRCAAELMMYHKVGIYKQRNCVVNSCPTYPEPFLLFELFKQVVYFKIAVD